MVVTVVTVPISFDDKNAVEGTDFEVLDNDGNVQLPGSSVVVIPAGETSARLRIRTLTVTDGGRQFIRPAAEFNNYGLQLQECPFSHMGPPGSWGRKTHEYDAKYDTALDGSMSDWWTGCHNAGGDQYKNVLSLTVTEDESTLTPGGTNAYQYATADNTAQYGCMLRQFLGSQIGAWEKVTTGNLSSDPALNQNHLSIYVKEGTSTHFTVTLLDRTKQGEGDPTDSKTAVFEWVGGVPQIAATTNLSGPNDGAGYEIHGVPVRAGWYRCYIHFETASDEDEDVAQYIFRPVDQMSGHPLDANKYTYLWGAMFERNGTAGPSGMSDYQPWDHNKWQPAENCRPASTDISQYIQINSS